MARLPSRPPFGNADAGGLAAVHLARTRAVKNPVALKRLYPHIASVRELVGSFIDEAVALHAKDYWSKRGDGGGQILDEAKQTGVVQKAIEAKGLIGVNVVTK